MEQRVLERDAFLTDGVDPADIEALRRVIDHMIDRADLLLQDAMKLAEEKGQGRH
jgi:hypothetical protein